MKFYTVCTLPHYFPEDVYKLHKQLQLFYEGKVELFVYTDRPDEFNQSVNVIKIQHNLCQRQWYKVDFFKPGFIDVDEPVIVTDLDWLILDDITEIIDTAVSPDEFITIERWWRENTCKLKVNGGMYKFFPKTMKKTYDVFYSNPKFWQEVYFGPQKIEGEQNFVADVVSLTHKIKHFPSEKIYRYTADASLSEQYAKWYEQKFNASPMINGRFNRQLALVHGRLSYS